MTAQHPDGSGSALAERVYRFLLRLYPRQFRRQYGSEMIAVFRYIRMRGDFGIRFWGWLLERYPVPALTLLHPPSGMRSKPIALRSPMR